MEELGTPYSPSPNGSTRCTPKAQTWHTVQIDWTEEKLIELWNRRRLAEERNIPWGKFVDVSTRLLLSRAMEPRTDSCVLQKYYPGASLTGVRFKYYVR